MVKKFLFSLSLIGITQAFSQAPSPFRIDRIENKNFIPFSTHDVNIDGVPDILMQSSDFQRGLMWGLNEDGSIHQERALKFPSIGKIIAAVSAHFADDYEKSLIVVTEDGKVLRIKNDRYNRYSFSYDPEFMDDLNVSLDAKDAKFNISYIQISKGVLLVGTRTMGEISTSFFRYYDWVDEFGKKKIVKSEIKLPPVIDVHSDNEGGIFVLTGEFPEASRSFDDPIVYKYEIHSIRRDGDSQTQFFTLEDSQITNFEMIDMNGDSVKDYLFVVESPIANFSKPYLISLLCDSFGQLSEQDDLNNPYGQKLKVEGLKLNLPLAAGEKITAIKADDIDRDGIDDLVLLQDGETQSLLVKLSFEYAIRQQDYHSTKGYAYLDWSRQFLSGHIASQPPQSAASLELVDLESDNLNDIIVFSGHNIFVAKNLSLPQYRPRIERIGIGSSSESAQRPRGGFEGAPH